MFDLALLNVLSTKTKMKKQNYEIALYICLQRLGPEFNFNSFCERLFQVKIPTTAMN